MRRFLARYPEPAVKTQDLITILPGNVPQSANLKAWWRADSGLFQDSGLVTPATAEGDPVGGWVDRFASAAAVQATTTKRGTLRLTQIWGRPAVRFVSANDAFLRNTSAAGAFSGSAVPNTFLVVFQLASVPGGSPYCLFGVSNVPTGAQQFIRAVTTWNDRQFTDAGASIVIGGGVPDTRPHLMTCRFDGSQITVRVDGQLLGTGVGAQTAITVTDLNIGARNSGNNPADAFIAEAVAYNAALTGASIAAWETYFARRYGIPLV